MARLFSVVLLLLVLAGCAGTPPPQYGGSPCVPEGKRCTSARCFAIRTPTERQLTGSSIVAVTPLGSRHGRIDASQKA